MNGLVNKLLTVARADSGFEQLNVSNVQVDQLLTNTLANYETKFEEKQVTVNKNMAKVMIKTDEILLQQLFDIFIDNASKYTNEKGVLDVSLEAKGREGIIIFQNTGDGISEEDLPKIFDRFYRTNEVRQKYEGSYGLGLSIAQGIIEQLGGTINVESTINEVTKFTIRLPLKKQFSTNK